MKSCKKLVDNDQEIVITKNLSEYIKLQCNSLLSDYYNPTEMENIHKYLLPLAPQNILEIGCGIGRMSVYLYKYYNWVNSHFFLLGGDSGTKQICNINPDLKSGFYNSLEATKEFCTINGIKNYTIINAEKDYYKLNLPKFDLVYSFLSIGFHFDLKLYMNSWLKSHLADDALLLFGIRSKEHHNWNLRQLSQVDKNDYSIVEFLESPQKITQKTSVLVLKKLTDR